MAQAGAEGGSDQGRAHWGRSWETDALSLANSTCPVHGHQYSSPVDPAACSSPRVWDSLLPFPRRSRSQGLCPTCPWAFFKGLRPDDPAEHPSAPCAGEHAAKATPLLEHPPFPESDCCGCYVCFHVDTSARSSLSRTLHGWKHPKCPSVTNKP